jgi:hypothetical protein
MGHKRTPHFHLHLLFHSYDFFLMKNQVSSPDELTCDVIGSCDPKLIYCPKCPCNKLAPSWEYSTHFSWGCHCAAINVVLSGLYAGGVQK